MECFRHCHRTRRLRVRLPVCIDVARPPRQHTCCCARAKHPRCFIFLSSFLFSCFFACFGLVFNPGYARARVSRAHRRRLAARLVKNSPCSSTTRSHRTLQSHATCRATYQLLAAAADAHTAAILVAVAQRRQDARKAGIETLGLRACRALRRCRPRYGHQRPQSCEYSSLST
ncbi:hypothetical protein DFH06DRAFT_1445956, partial [Mycena polygramma]